MTDLELQDLLHRVHRGAIDPSTAADEIVSVLRRAPFEDLGFARVDTHRALRQGFPEVIYGAGKTSGQVLQSRIVVVQNPTPQTTLQVVIQ